MYSVKLVWLTQTGTSFGQFSHQFLFLITWDWFKSLSLVWFGPSLPEENYSECTGLWKQESDTILPTCKSCWLYGVWRNKFAKFSLSCESNLVVHWLIDWLNTCHKKGEYVYIKYITHYFIVQFPSFFRKISWGKYPYPPQGRLLEIPRRWGSQQLIFLNVSMRLNWNFQRGGVFKSKNLPWRGGGNGFFSGTTE